MKKVFSTENEKYLQYGRYKFNLEKKNKKLQLKVEEFIKECYSLEIEV